MVDRKFRLARIWSNNELKRFAHYFQGDIVNVSAWDDRDKQGGHYSDYFSHKTNYHLTNYYGYRGQQGKDNEFILDLTGEVPEELLKRFDVVFNHTTLEHIFDIQTAFKNLCNLSKDVVIIVVPFSQVQHESPSYKDYWRFTPTLIRSLFEENGLDVVYLNYNDDINAAIYIFAIATRNPENYQDMIPAFNKKIDAGECIGSDLKTRLTRLVRNYFRFN